MKSFNLILVSFLIGITFCLCNCKKNYESLTITLYKQPLSVIQSYIEGKWKCHYGKGGITGNMVQYYNDVYWEFNGANKILLTNNGVVIADTTIRWYKDRGTYTNGDSTFIMQFFNKQNAPSTYVVDRIFKDTLVLHDNSADAVFYFFTK